MKIAWFIGHDFDHAGVYSDTLMSREYDLAKLVVDKGVSLLYNRFGSNIDVLSVNIKPTGKTAGEVLIEKINKINAWQADYAIESHFNGSSNINAGGCETIYFSLPFNNGAFSIKGKKLAEFIQKETLINLNTNIDRNFKIKDRGVKGMGSIIRNFGRGETNARFAFLTKTKMPAIILEPFFITSPEDCEVFKKGGSYREKEIELLAKSVVDGIFQFNASEEAGG